VPIFSFFKRLCLLRLKAFGQTQMSEARVSPRPDAAGKPTGAGGKVAPAKTGDLRSPGGAVQNHRLHRGLAGEGRKGAQNNDLLIDLILLHLKSFFISSFKLLYYPKT
jgi:hypothetical protein